MQHPYANYWNVKHEIQWKVKNNIKIWTLGHFVYDRNEENVFPSDRWWHTEHKTQKPHSPSPLCATVYTRSPSPPEPETLASLQPTRARDSRTLNTSYSLTSPVSSTVPA